MIRRGSHDDAADGLATGIEDGIESLRKQSRRLAAPPVTTCTQPASRYSGKRLAMSLPVAGASSLGFTTATFPAAMAPTSGSSSS